MDLGPTPSPPSVIWMSSGGGHAASGGLQIDFTISGSEFAGTATSSGGATFSASGLCTAAQ